MGSDYTNGLEGVGPVLGLEILSEFPSNSTCHFEGLVQFREWWEEAQSANEDFFCKSKVKEKLRKLHLKSGMTVSNYYYQVLKYEFLTIMTILFF